MFKKVRRILSQYCTNIYNICFNRPIGYAYMFHMVAPCDGAIASIDELRVSPEFFRKFLKEKQRSINFVSIDDAFEIILGRKKSEKPFCIITFDDGYEDNYKYAYPILKELGIPFTIYVSVDLVDDHRPIWNYPLIIEKIVRNNDFIKLSNGNVYECNTEEEKCNTFFKLKSLLFSLPYKTLQTEFKKLFENYLSDNVFPTNTLTWEQIKILSEDELCTIGSHTMSHCRLAMSDVDILTYELKNSKEILSHKIGKPVEHLSYPYGWITDVSDEAAEIVQKVGYKTAFHSFGGPIRQNDKDIFHLHRIMINE